MDFRRVLATTRRKKKITQKEVARRMGYTRGAINRFENYKADLSYQALLKYISIINCKLIIIPKEHYEREESDLDPN